MIKYSDGIHMQMKVSLLKKILNIVTTVLTLDHGVCIIFLFKISYRFLGIVYAVSFE